ncbi:YjbE family putative metal transport protein [Alphaproteobacteria bacterium]|nr:YjbE family putative metal transport protein [Alphaproteobacteria bacterium]
MTEWLLEILQIIIADIVLSGDNALIIGMAASAVPEQHRKKVIFIGLMAAAVLRILFALVASYLISIPGLLLLGGLLLFWVCWKFYQDIKEFSLNKEDDEKLKNDVSSKGLKAALITIIIADVSMSLDNVIAITAIARDDKTLLILGIAFAILLMAFFATAIVNLLTKFRWLSYLGLAFLIYLSGKMTFDGWLQIYPFLIA